MIGRPRRFIAAGTGALAALSLAAPGAAVGASGTPITLAANGGTQPSVAVDASGTAYVAWPNSDPSATTNIIRWCVIPAGAGACSAHGSITPSQALGVNKVTVVIDNSQVLIVGNSLDAQGVNIREWVWNASTSAFDEESSGHVIAHGNTGSTTFPVGAVQLPGGPLGYGWTTTNGAPTFTTWKLNSPPQCSFSTCTGGGNLATLDSSHADPLSMTSDAGIASITATGGAQRGVLAAYVSNTDSGSLGCPGASDNHGVAVAYGTGAQDATSNDYGTSPGTNSAWQDGLRSVACHLDNVAVAGTKQFGFGILADDLTAGDIVYRPFNASSDTLATGVALPGPETFESSPSLGTDSAGGLYATFDGLNGVELAYSADGGATWQGPMELGDSFALYLTSAVGTGGQGWAVWTSGSNVIAQPFVKGDAAPAVTTLTTSIEPGYPSTEPAGKTGFYDDAELDGPLVNQATGSVHYGLYSAADCSAASLVFDGGTHGVSVGLTEPSDPLNVALPAGTYYWQASYSGDSFNAASTSACGSDVLTMTAGTTTTNPGTGTGTGTGTGAGTDPGTGTGPGTGTTTKPAPLLPPTALGIRLSHAGPGVTVTTYGTVTVTGRSARYIPLVLSSTGGVRRFVVQLLGTPRRTRRGHRPKAPVLAHLTVRTKHASVQLTLPASLKPGTYTLSVTAYSTGRHAKKIGHTTRKVRII